MMEVPKEVETYAKKRFNELILMLQIILKRVVEQETLLNEIKAILLSEGREICEEEQASFNPLEYLMQSDNEENNGTTAADQNNNNSEKNPSEIVCHDCKQAFKRGTGDFTQHLRVSTCKPYKCNFCPKLFKKKSNMMTHQLTHSVEVFKCDECNSSFKCQKYLTSHKMRKHKAEKEVNNNNNSTSVDLKSILKREAVDVKEDVETSDGGKEPSRKKVRYDFKVEQLERFINGDNDHQRQ